MNEPENRPGQFDLVSWLRSNPVIALVGATNSETKYGNIIYKDLKKKGYQIFPVNPRATTVDGDRAYHTLEELHREHPVGLVVYVIPPKYTLENLEQTRDLGIDKVWIQPGAGDEEVRDYLNRGGYSYLMDACVMVETLNR